MKRNLLRVGVLALAGVLSLGLVATTAGAAVLFTEDFTYTDGSLVPNGGWASHSGTLGDLLVASGKAVVKAGPGTEDVNHGFTPVAGNVYYRFDFSVDVLGTPWTGTDSEYFIHFKVVGSTTFFTARVDIVPPPGGGDYSVGLATASGTAEATWPTGLTYGTTYRGVVRYDQAGDVAQLWVDPAVSTDPSITSADLTDPGDSVGEIGLRQSGSSMTETIRVDNIAVGATFEDLVPPPAPVASTAGMMVLASLMLGAGALFVVRRRATVV